MKEASGELSMTAVAVVIIGIVAVQAAYACEYTSCTTNTAGEYTGGSAKCKYRNENDVETDITCSCKDIAR